MYSGDDDDATSTSSVLSETVVINGNAIIDVPDNTTLTLSGISGAGTLDKRGGGTLILTGQSTYTGGTDIEGGTLQLGDGTTDGSLVGNVADNSALVFNDQAALTYTGVISGSGSVAQIGGGTLTLTGSNTYSGGTTVNGGTLQLGDGTGAGSEGLWKFDETSGTTASDSSGNGNTGTLVNGAAWTTGKIGGAVALNGQNAYVSVPDAPGLEYAGGDMTIGDLDLHRSEPNHRRLCRFQALEQRRRVQLRGEHQRIRSSQFYFEPLQF